jgi:hypothetical protein
MYDLGINCLEILTILVDQIPHQQFSDSKSKDDAKTINKAGIPHPIEMEDKLAFSIQSSTLSRNIFLFMETNRIDVQSLKENSPAVPNPTESLFENKLKWFLKCAESIMKPTDFLLCKIIKSAKDFCSILQDSTKKSALVTVMNSVERIKRTLPRYEEQTSRVSVRNESLIQLDLLLNKLQSFYLRNYQYSNQRAVQKSRLELEDLLTRICSPKLKRFENQRFGSLVNIDQRLKSSFMIEIFEKQKSGKLFNQVNLDFNKDLDSRKGATEMCTRRIMEALGSDGEKL